MDAWGVKAFCARGRGVAEGVAGEALHAAVVMAVLPPLLVLLAHAGLPSAAAGHRLDRPSTPCCCRGVMKQGA